MNTLENKIDKNIEEALERYIEMHRQKAFLDIERPPLSQEYINYQTSKAQYLQSQQRLYFYKVVFIISFSILGLFLVINLII